MQFVWQICTVQHRISGTAQTVHSIFRPLYRTVQWFRLHIFMYFYLYTNSHQKFIIYPVPVLVLRYMSLNRLLYTVGI